MKSNQLGISKSNTVPQLEQAVIIIVIPKNIPQNEVNQKELPQLKNISQKKKSLKAEVT